MEESFRKIAGIDFGSKQAGTTVIAYPAGRPAAIRFAQCPNKVDADRFIGDWVALHRPCVLFLDAPLSLPGVYRHLAGYDDFFYRQADRQLRAMSPMFLGGLTARAMRLERHFRDLKVRLLEVYPAALARTIGIAQAGYKQGTAVSGELLSRIAAQLPAEVDPALVTSWHHVDAMLALLSGWRFLAGTHQSYGDAEEGMIIV